MPTRGRGVMLWPARACGHQCDAWPGAVECVGSRVCGLPRDLKAPRRLRVSSPMLTTHRPPDAACEPLIGGSRELAQSWEQLQLPVLVPATVVEHPIPLARHIGQPPRPVGTPPE